MVELSTKERATLALSLFMAAMRMGPDSFYTMQAIANKTGVMAEFCRYANDWNAYSDTVLKAREEGVTPFPAPDDLPGPGIPGNPRP